MVDRISALAGNYHTGKSGILRTGECAGVRLKEVPNLVLHQVAAWPDSIESVGKEAAEAAGCRTTPGPCRAEANQETAILRVEPLKWWLIGVAAPVIDAGQGVTLDLSHSRTRIRITGNHAAEFLNRHLSLDLREYSFPVGSVGSTAIHHVGVTLWRSASGYELFIPRGFALSLWEGFVESATQFGLEVI